ncbi:MAG: tetratricopeptide repeat protein, partial [Lachnospiraceae bacterium]|nr:tetratricopeptide repeat protein [Lachnospiraceae bacterium]
MGSTPGRAALAAGILISVFLTLTGCTKDTAHIDEADLLIENGSYSEALESLEAAEEAGEDMILVHRSRGIADMGLSDYDAAVDEFTAALSSNKGYVRNVDIDISYYLATAEYRSGDIKGANETYSAIIALYPKEADAFFLRGRTYLALQDTDNAKSDFDKAIKLSPGDPDLYVQVYEALAEAGLSDDGQRYLKSAMELNTKLSSLQKGRLYYSMGDYERAKENLENAAQSGDSQAILYLGKTYEALGDTNYASTLYKSYIDTDPGNAQVMNQLGLCLMDLKDYGGALDTFNKGIEIGDPAMDQSLRFNQIVACEQMGDFERAKTMIKDYLTLYPDDEEAIRENEF